MIHITPNAIAIEDASGKRHTVTVEKLKTPTHRLLWGVFYQLQQANVRLGYVDEKKGEGSGLTALLHQIAGNTGAIHGQLEKLNETFERIEKQSRDAATSMDPAATMKEAMAAAREMVGHFGGPTPPAVGVPTTKPGNGGAGS